MSSLVISAVDSMINIMINLLMKNIWDTIHNNF